MFKRPVRLTFAEPDRPEHTRTVTAVSYREKAVLVFSIRLGPQCLNPPALARLLAQTKAV